ncbi:MULTISPECIES: YqkE family protein [Bacillus]|uniref:YqkE family protein n=1 Tax=Bacillus TaxID=1386 RepID=UPI000BB9568B|nr:MULTISPECIES: YqkE family protein [Bacillus]
MSKKRKQQKHQENFTKSKKEETPTLKDQLQDDVFSKLKSMKQNLQDKETAKQEEEAARKREEAKRKEKNKSFEDLLNDSNLNWKEYK